VFAFLGFQRLSFYGGRLIYSKYNLNSYIKGAVLITDFLYVIFREVLLTVTKTTNNLLCI
jgi:hypothetical protein